MASLTPEQAAILAEKKLLGTLTEAEDQALQEWVNQQLPASLEWTNDGSEEELKNRLYAQIRDKAGIERTIPRVHRVHFLRRFKWAAAAALILVCSATWFLLQKQGEPPIQTANKEIQAPVTNKATLTINGSKQVTLESLQNGSLDAAGLQGLTKKNASTLAYNGVTDKIETHTWSNPKASQPLQLKLPDGSQVWLNAASTISFPSRFSGQERVVEITGEAYFEVKHNAAQPFRVKAGNQTIEDIGTAFNVNAYDDETGVRTTLIEGIVKVQEKKIVKTLKPGEDFFNGQVAEANTDQAIAWKNGLFSFGNTVDLSTALREIGRWYGVEIVYEGQVPDREFGGKLPRSLSLNKVIEILSEQKVHARIEGNRLIVQP